MKMKDIKKYKIMREDICEAIATVLVSALCVYLMWFCAWLDSAR